MFVVMSKHLNLNLRVREGLLLELDILALEQTVARGSIVRRSDVARALLESGEVRRAALAAVAEPRYGCIDELEQTAARGSKRA